MLQYTEKIDSSSTRDKHITGQQTHQGMALAVEHHFENVESTRPERHENIWSTVEPLRRRSNLEIIVKVSLAPNAAHVFNVQIMQNTLDDF